MVNEVITTSVNIQVASVVQKKMTEHRTFRNPNIHRMSKAGEVKDKTEGTQIDQETRERGSNKVNRRLSFEKMIYKVRRLEEW